jgi:hypothetical protein
MLFHSSPAGLQQSLCRALKTSYSILYPFPTYRTPSYTAYGPHPSLRTRSITAQTRDFYRGSGFKSPAEQLPEFRFTLPLIQPTRLKAAWPGRIVVWLI